MMNRLEKCPKCSQLAEVKVIDVSDFSRGELQPIPAKKKVYSPPTQSDKSLEELIRDNLISVEFANSDNYIILTKEMVAELAKAISTQYVKKTERIYKVM